MKKQGNLGQQEKACRMLQSRKIVSVNKVHQELDNTFVKAMIKKSYGRQARPAVSDIFYWIYSTKGAL